MAPPTTYDPPHVQLGDLMVLARRRGLTFEEFWAEAMRPGRRMVQVTDADPPAGAVRWPTDRNDRVTWHIAVVDTREGWRRAFEREPPSASERAIAFLADAIGALVQGEREAARRRTRPLAAA